jgi:hypothetical protein
MLAYQWMEGSVPDDPAFVAALCGVSQAEVAPHWGAVRSRFRVLKNSTLRNTRMEKLRRAKTGVHHTLSEKKKKAANTRWSKQRSSNAPALHSDANYELLTTNYKLQTDKTPLPPGPDFETEWQRLKAAYPKDANLHSQPTESAWVDAVLSATDPPKVLTEVHSGLARMKASGTPTRFMPTLKDFLLNGRFREAWPPEVELPQTAPEPSVIERLKRMGKL